MSRTASDMPPITGPASLPELRLVDQAGNVFHMSRGRLHRADGPAVEYANGACEWYRDGKLDRDDGPARYWLDAEGRPEREEYWFDGIHHATVVDGEVLYMRRLGARPSDSPEGRDGSNENKSNQ